MATMADGFTSTENLPPYVLADYLIVLATNLCRNFVDDRNNNVNDVGELSDRAGGKTDTDSGSIFDGYSDVSDDECDGVNAGDELRTVLSMLDDMRSLIFVRRKRCL